MVWFILNHIFSTILTIITIGRPSTLEKDLEVLILRQQFSILQRKLNSLLKPNRFEKLTLVVLTIKLKRISHLSTSQLRNVIRIFQPETVLRWHRQLVRWKWTYSSKKGVGRPKVRRELENLIIWIAKENPRGVTVKSNATFMVSPSMMMEGRIATLCKLTNNLH